MNLSLSECLPCLIIIPSWYFDNRIDKPLAYSRCMICVPCPVHLRTIGFFILITHKSCNEVEKSDHMDVPCWLQRLEPPHQPFDFGRQHFWTLANCATRMCLSRGCERSVCSTKDSWSTKSGCAYPSQLAWHHRARNCNQYSCQCDQSTISGNYNTSPADSSHQLGD